MSSGAFFMGEAKEVNMVVGTLVVLAYVVPSVIFGLALKPAAEVFEAVGRSASR